jgi:hypothetical protein
MNYTSNIKAGDHVKVRLNGNEDLDKYKYQVLHVENVFQVNGVDMLMLNGATKPFGCFWFKRLTRTPKFKVGDKARYTCQTHTHLVGKELIVAKVCDFAATDQYLLCFKDIPHHYVEEYFEPITTPKVNYPSIKEILTELCNKDIVNEKISVNIHIVNSNIKDSKSYSKNDLMTVLRCLDSYNVRADILMTSKMDDALTLVLSGEDIMDELGSDRPTTCPVTAIIELSDLLDLTVGIDDHNFIYQIGYGGVVYSTEEFNPSTQAVSTVQTTGEAS